MAPLHRRTLTDLATVLRTVASATVRSARLPDRRPLLALAVAVIARELVGASGVAYTAVGLESWYRSLERPALAPPNRVFGPVWTTLFAPMGVAAWLVCRSLTGPDWPAARLALGLFADRFVLNLARSVAFFGAQSILGELVVIVLLWVAILATLWAFYRVDWRAGIPLVPYLAWVSFGAYLTYGFWILN